ncbi:MAG: hypothetical protein M3Q65_10745 [Chloroflexota bacterium]|nr:hypothetical protein [Chloroflexota bacterium]
MILGLIALLVAVASLAMGGAYYAYRVAEGRRGMRLAVAHRSPLGLIALLVALESLAVGVVYYAYLVAVPFPPDWVRIVALIWLAGALAGLLLGLAAILANARRHLGIAALVLSIPSVPLAAIFALAALMGG